MMLAVLDPSARWDWTPPGQDGAPAESRVALVCRYPSVREFLKSGAALKRHDESDHDLERITALLDAIRPIVVSVRVGDEARDFDAIVDIATPRELREWTVKLYVEAQLSEITRGKSAAPSPTAAGRSARVAVAAESNGVAHA